jgi:threonine dehydrogenase-like Zn-dependent dehydrogenase
MLFQEVHILSSNSYSHTGMRRDYAIAMELLASGTVSHDFVVTHRFPIGSWRDAIATAFDKKGTGCLRAVMFHDN